MTYDWLIAATLSGDWLEKTYGSCGWKAEGVDEKHVRNIEETHHLMCLSLFYRFVSCCEDPGTVEEANDEV